MPGYTLERTTALELAAMLRDYKRRFKNVEVGETLTANQSIETNPVEIVRVTGSAIANGSQPGVLTGLGFDPTTGAAVFSDIQEISIYSLSGPLPVGTYALGCLIADFWVVGGASGTGSGGLPSGPTSGSGPGGSGSGESGSGGSGGGGSGGSGGSGSSGPPGTIKVLVDVDCVDNVLVKTYRYIYGAFAD